MNSTLFVSLLLVVGCVLALGGCKTSRLGYESAPYAVVQSEGGFEIRDYPELTIVEASMSESGTDETTRFRKLFGYITGKNQANQKIAMTTPVFISGGKGTMSFVMPAEFSIDAAPRPLDSSLVIKKIPAGRFAVLRFSGGRSSNKESEKLVLLKSWISSQDLVAEGEPVYGYFDPPWTLAFLRRNEVMLRVEMKR